MLRLNAQQIIVPLRFLSIATFLVLIAMVTYTVKSNIYATFPYDLSSNWDGAVGSAITAICVMAVCLVIQLIGFVGGCTFFNQFVSVIGILFNFSGCIATLVYILAVYHVNRIWFIWLVFLVIPTFAELVAIFNIFVLRKHEY